jgi:integrator complex subunit 1
MELLDPEIITAQPDLEVRFILLWEDQNIPLCAVVYVNVFFLCFLKMRLLFGKTPNPPSCRPYALAMLVHQASWATLRKCIQKLLGARDIDAFEAKVVLDFLAALIKVPKLWQGRDKHVPKHQQPEELLNLNHQQVSVDPLTHVLILLKAC